MSNRPQSLLYAVDETPPARVVGVMATQHLVLGLMFMMYPIILASELALTGEARTSMVTTACLMVGLGTIIQSSRWGCGYLAVCLPNPVTMMAFVGAVRTAGLGAACGTLAVCGLLQMGLARVLPRLRAFIPPEVCGVAVLMLGVSMVSGGLRRFSGFDPQAQTADSSALIVSSVTLAIIIGLSVWSRGSLRLYSIMAGCIVGYVLAMFLGQGSPDLARDLAEAPLLGLPIPTIPALSFDINLFLPFFILILLNITDAVGSVVTLDKMNNAHWARTDMKVLGRSVFADGFTTTLSSALGGFGIAFSSANIGLAFASSVTSRVIGLVTGALMIAAAFMPKLIVVLLHMPEPVVGAILVFSAACLMTAGMELVMLRMLNERRMMVIGLSMVAGLAVPAVPGLYHGVPDWIAPMFESELTVASVAALLLNILFRIGISRRATLTLAPETTRFDAFYDFMERQGMIWGARRDVVQRATLGTLEALEAVAALRDHINGPVTIDASFDELSLDLRLRYQGPPLVGATEDVDVEKFFASDSHEDIDVLMRSVSNTLITRIADRVKSTERNGETTLHLHFEH